MTIEQLLACSPEQLEAMTDAELQAHFTPYLKVTRPELQETKREKSTIKHAGYSTGHKSVSKEKADKIRQAKIIAKQFGFDLGI